MDLPGLTGPAPAEELLEPSEQEARRLLEQLRERARVEIRDLGSLRRRLEITVPAEVIDDALRQELDELRHEAQLPGFRRGHAPPVLIEKRFGPQVRESLKARVVGQAYLAVVEREKLDVLGDPLFEVPADGGVKLTGFEQALEQLTLPQHGELHFACEVEVRPTFELPELKGIPIREPDIRITDQDIDERLARQARIRGRYEPSAEPARDADDLVVADVVLTVDGTEVKREENVQVGVRPARLDGIPIPDLGEKLRGARPGERRVVACTIPDDYERTDLRGRPAELAFQVHEVKRLVPLPLEELAAQLGAASTAELRELARQELENERERLARRARREQVFQYLLDHTALELPAGLSARQTDRAVMRRVIELQQMGVPPDEIEAQIDRLHTTARDEVARDLKLEFILEKVAEQLDVTVRDEEVNSEIARIARVYGRRFDRVRDELQRRGLLLQLVEQIRIDKCVQRLLEHARRVEPEPPAAAPAPEAPRPRARRRRSAAAPEAGQPAETPATPQPTPRKARQARPKRTE